MQATASVIENINRFNIAPAASGVDLVLSFLHVSRTGSFHMSCPFNTVTTSQYSDYDQTNTTKDGDSFPKRKYRPFYRCLNITSYDTCFRFTSGFVCFSLRMENP